MINNNKITDERKQELDNLVQEYRQIICTMEDYLKELKKPIVYDFYKPDMQYLSGKIKEKRQVLNDLVKTLNDLQKPDGSNGLANKDSMTQLMKHLAR